MGDRNMQSEHMFIHEYIQTDLNQNMMLDLKLHFYNGGNHKVKIDAVVVDIGHVKAINTVQWKELRACPYNLLLKICSSSTAT